MECNKNNFKPLYNQKLKELIDYIVATRVSVDSKTLKKVNTKKQVETQHER